MTFYLDHIKHTPTGSAARRTAKSTLRGAGMATARWRPSPDLLLIGAKRGGSTSMHRYLLEHPSVLPTFPQAQQVKGTYYFTDHFGRGEAWYRSHFPSVARRAVVRRATGVAAALESTPYYLYHPLAPWRAAVAAPDAQVIVALRNPVERAYSHWKERRASDGEPLGFAEAIAAEERRTAGELERILADPLYVSAAHRHHSYVDQGRYAPALRRWFDAFGRDRVHVVICDELFADPAVVYERLVRDLGLPPYRLRDRRVHNDEPSAPMAADVRDELTARLRPDVAELAELLGRPLPW